MDEEAKNRKAEEKVRYAEELFKEGHNHKEINEKLKDKFGSGMSYSTLVKLKQSLTEPPISTEKYGQEVYYEQKNPFKKADYMYGSKTIGIRKWTTKEPIAEIVKMKMDLDKAFKIIAMIEVRQAKIQEYESLLKRGGQTPDETDTLTRNLQKIKKELVSLYQQRSLIEGLEETD